MGERDYPARPWTGVGVIVWRGDEVVLVRRGKEPRKGQWSIPGGMQELGETARAAGIREVMEETGLAIAIDGLIDVIDLIVPDDAGRIRTHYTLIDYYGHCLEEGVEPRPGDDVDACCWVSHVNLKEYGLWPQTQRVIDESRVLRQRGILSGQFTTGE
ncbi:MAG: NUDIX hydrolase [Pseudomonadota bacterium]|jgi:8-oxo-dGTP diphosphatase